MDNQEEWGPWITHDGKGCPCVGEWVEVEFDDNRPNAEGRATKSCGNPDSGWDWANVMQVSVFIRYRIRKPLGLTMLEAIARDTTTPIVKVDA